MHTDRRNPELPVGRREAQGQLHNIINNIDDVILELDRNGRILFVSKPLSGYTMGAIVGRDFCDWAHVDDHAIMRTSLEHVFTTGESAWYELQGTGSEGATHWLESRLSPVVREQRVERVTLITADVTVRKQAEREATQKAALIELFYNLPLIGMSITDPVSRKWLKVNDKLCEMMGYSRAELLKIGWEALTHPDDLAMSQREFVRVLDGLSESYQIDKRLIHKSGAVVYTIVDVHCARNVHGGADYFVALIKDVTLRKLNEVRIHHMAHHDLLTDLPNRTLLADRLRQTLLQSRRNSTRFALLFIDLDKFKPVNDSYGHAAGDMVLRAVGLRLQGCVRASDTVARMGGDEFVILLSSIESEEDALQVANKVHETLATSFKLDEGRIAQISSSIGIALYPEHASDEITLLRLADDAMYVAKADGRGCVRVFQPPVATP